MAKFCTKCGKPLVEGQVCECQKSAAPVKEEPWRNQDFQNQSADASQSKPSIEFNAQKAEDAWNNFTKEI